MPDKQAIIPVERIEHAILLIRGQRVMLDADLARLYGVCTKRLNEQVKRNRDRFPEDFMFRLTPGEKAEVVANCDHLQRLKFSPALPYAFTECAYPFAVRCHPATDGAAGQAASAHRVPRVERPHHPD